MATDDRRSERGFALLAVMFLAAFLVSILAAYFFLSHIERSTARSSMDNTRGFYAAEAGLNLRISRIRQRFEGYNRPAGTSPSLVAGQLPCSQVDQGSGDFQCEIVDLQRRRVITHVVEPAGNPTPIVIPRGEPYQNLRAQEYAYAVNAVALNAWDRPEALLDVRVRSRLVPMFQFAAFYNKDLEILPGPDMFFDGPVHSNGNLYLGAGSSLTVNGQVTTAKQLFVGRKDEDVCSVGDIRVYDPSNPASLPGCSSGRRELTEPDLTPWHGMVRTAVDIAEVPPPETFDPTPGAIYWDSADMRLILNLDATPDRVEIRNPDDSVDLASTIHLNTVCGAAWNTESMYNFREDDTIKMLEVDVEGLMDCIHSNTALQGGRALDDSTEGGLVWYVGVEGPNSDTYNDYGVRVQNAEELKSTSVGAPVVQGLTIVTNQALYVQGDFNKTNKKPAAFLADSLNVLSNAWDDANSSGPLAGSSPPPRIAADTTIHAAFLAGTDTTGGAEGTPGHDGGVYNGGLENYPRFHENWSGRTLTYTGSFVSLDEPRHVNGLWEDQSYDPPIRDWSYDTDFNDAANLPPLSPRFIYMRQNLFVRAFDY